MTEASGEAQRLTAAIERARLADAAGFDEIYRALHPGLLRYLRVMVGDDAEDVASEAWLQIARDLDAFRGDWDRFRGWAVTIARNRAIDHARRLRRHPCLPIDELPDRADPADTADAALASMSTATAVGLLSTLPREQAEAILLRVVFALDAKSCGRILGRRAGAVRTAAHRGLRQLEKVLAAEQTGRSANAARTPSSRDDRQRQAVTPQADPTQMGR